MTTHQCCHLSDSGVRPFGVSLLVAGWDEDVQKPYLYQCDPSVCHVPFDFLSFVIIVAFGGFQKCI